MALNQVIRQADITWHGVTLDQPDWGASSHSLAFTAKVLTDRVCFHVILNAYWEPLEFELSSVAADQTGWRRLLDTSLDPPDDIAL